MKQGDMNQALTDAQEFISICPSNFTAHHYLGLLHMSMENHEDALTALATVSKAL